MALSAGIQITDRWGAATTPPLRPRRIEPSPRFRDVRDRVSSGRRFRRMLTGGCRTTRCSAIRRRVSDGQVVESYRELDGPEAAATAAGPSDTGRSRCSRRQRV
jgi:hypothetical protein